jgi:hypothetical protein
MSIQVSPNLPANVVEIGNEITQAKINEINSGTLATQTWVSDLGYISDATGSINNDSAIYARSNGGWTSLNIIAEPSYGTGLLYGRKNDSPSASWEVITSYTYDAKKAIANLCASCFVISANFNFTNYVAACVAQGSKFQMGSQYLLGIGIPGSAPTYSFTLTYSSPSSADTGIMATSVSGHCICYSDDYGSTWTYADLAF